CARERIAELAWKLRLPRWRSGEFTRRPIRSSSSCLALKCRTESSAKLFWLGLVKTWLALKRRWDTDCDRRQASAGVLTGSGARRPKVEGGKRDRVVVESRRLSRSGDRTRPCVARW